MNFCGWRSEGSTAFLRQARSTPPALLPRPGCVIYASGRLPRNLLTNSSSRQHGPSYRGTLSLLLAVLPEIPAWQHARSSFAPSTEGEQQWRGGATAREGGFHGGVRELHRSWHGTRAKLSSNHGQRQHHDAVSSALARTREALHSHPRPFFRAVLVSAR